MLSTRAEITDFQMCSRVHESQTSRERVKYFQPAGTRRDSLTREKKLGDSLLTQFGAQHFHGADVRDALFFKKTKMYRVKMPLASLGPVVMKNTQICDSLLWTKMSPR